MKHILKYKIVNTDSSSSSDSDSKSTWSKSSTSYFRFIESGGKLGHGIHFEFDSTMSFKNADNKEEDLEYFALPIMNCVDSDNPIFKEEIPKEIIEFTEREERHAKPIFEEIITVNIGSEKYPKMVKIDATLSFQESKKLTLLLKEYKDVFAKSYEDMPEIDPKIVQHKIPPYLDAMPIKQKLRRMRPDWVLKIKEEVTKQIDVGFLIVTKYPQLVANIVLVPKKNEGIKVCVDF